MQDFTLPATASDDRRREARRHVHALRAWYGHLTTYLLVIGGLAFLNWMTGHGAWWVQWVALGWGIGLVAHSLRVWLRRGVFGHDWEARKVEEYLRRP